MQIVDAVVRFPAGQPRTSSSGRPYVSALFTTSGGEELRVFASPDSSVTPALQQLQPGQAARLAIDSKGRAHYCVPDGQESQPMGFHPQPAAPAAVPVPVVQHQQPAAYQTQPAAPVPADPDPVVNMADAWGKAFARLLAQGVPPEQAGPGASTILIQLGRR